MLAGLGLLAGWAYFLAVFKDVTIVELKNFLLIGGVLAILMVVELIWEIKKGFKLFFWLLGKAVLSPIKMLWTKRRIKKIRQKLNNGQALTAKELKTYKKHHI